MTATTPTWIRVDAPDGAAALALERRLSHLHPITIGLHDRWYVEFEDFDDRVEEIVAGVRYWLRTRGLAGTTVHIDDAERTVEAEMHDEPALGAGYDCERVLEHEP